MRDFEEKRVEFKLEAWDISSVATGEVQGGEIGKPLKQETRVRECCSIDSERELEIVGDGEELFRYAGQRVQIATVFSVVAAVGDQFEDKYPAIIR